MGLAKGLVIVSFLVCWLYRAALSSKNCVRVSPCFTYSYGPCSAEKQLLLSNGTSPVFISILEPGPQDDWLEPFLQAALTLLCQGLFVSTSSGEQNDIMMTSPYCWSVAPPTSCETECGNCTAIELSVVEQLTQTVVSASQMAAVLNDANSKTAFQFAGFTVVSVTSREGQSSDDEELDLFDVPTASWVCVGMGTIVSLVVLLKPLWWDKLIMWLCGARKSETVQESLDLDPPPASGLTLTPPPPPKTLVHRTETADQN